MMPSASTYSSISSKMEFTSARGGRNTVRATDVVSTSSGNEAENKGFPAEIVSNLVNRLTKL